jgi:hypothetical protein
MRGFWVKWSPDSPGCDAVKTRTEPGNPEAEKHLEIFTGNYKRLPRGNPYPRPPLTPEKPEVEEKIKRIVEELNLAI